MNFEAAFAQAKAGDKISLPEWGGYWVWDEEKSTIIIHNKDKTSLDFRETKDVNFTLSHTFRDDWEVVECIDPDDPGSWLEELSFHPQYRQLIRRGERGPIVEAIQKKLNDHGARLNPDGDFGSATFKAVVRFQKSKGLVADGVVGEKTLIALDGEEPTWLLTQAQIEAAAERLKVPVAGLMAFNEVESNGHGFLPSGAPKILFERHWMYRRMKHYGEDPTPFLVSHPNIVATITRGYLGGEREWDRLAEARKIHEESALESASWGAFQIMGFHWKALGYKSIHEFVRLMQQDEGEHLEAVVRFIENDPKLHQALRHQNWHVAAERYNGRNYRKPPPGYHVLFKRAFDRFVQQYPVAA